MKKGKGRNNKLLPSSLRIISSCIKTVSTNASTVVRSAGASVAVSISSSADDRKEQVLCASFDKLELCPTSVRCVLLLGYQNGFQVFDVEDSARLCELVSRREGPVTFLQVLPTPENFDGAEKYKISPPMLVVVGGDKDESNSQCGNIAQGPARYGSVASSSEPPTIVRFYSLKLNEYVKVFDFKSAVFMVRCSHRVIAVGLQEQIYCFDSLTLEKKFIVVTYPVPRFGEQGVVGISTGYGPMDVGPRWLAYPPNRPFLLNTGRLIPKNLASSATLSTSPGNGSMMTRYAMESSKHLASGILTLGDIGYKKLSKYCPELLHPDSPSPPGWKAGSLAACEPENAGVVVVKDLVSSEVVSQFRAHKNPISALCFDPSCTLLVTASVHGNHINIFRIMPSHSCGGSGSSDWSTSSVHLYKLYRGITTAVIQDICFSNYSQWVAIVSSKGTCHIFVLSPFGGDDFQALKSHGQGGSLVFTSTPPWWSTSSFTTNEQNCMPPPTCVLAVVSRIKCSDSGLLNSVSNAAASAVGKVWVPSGAVAAIFHNSNSSGSLNVPTSASSLEHILVCTPSGFVVQHEIWPSIGSAPSERKTESRSAPQVNPQNEEFTVKVEPVQWWDVCRRLDNLEREECISGSTFDGQGDPEIHNTRKNIQEINSARSKNVLQSNSLRLLERSHLYLSNSEVQLNSCRIPIWQKSKIQFHVMQAPRKECFFGGEFEIEMASSCEVEIRHKDLLPTVNHFARVRSGWIERSMPSEGRYPYTLPSDSTQAGEKINEASIMYHSKPPSFSSTESSEGGSSRQIENLLDLDHMNIDRSPLNISRSANNLDMEREEITSIKGSVHDGADLVVHNTSLSGSSSSANGNSSSDVSSASAAEILMPSGTDKEVDFGQFFKEGYCDMPNLHDHNHSTEVTTVEVETYNNAQIEESSLEEGWLGDMFELGG